MQITVPFLYEALITRSGCRKPSRIVIKDEVELTISDKLPEDVPVAFVIGETKLRWDGCFLWDFIYHTSISSKKKVSIEELNNLTKASFDGNRLSSSSFRSPFYDLLTKTNHKEGFSDKLSTGTSISDHGLLICKALKKEEVLYEKWLNDNKDDILKIAKKIAASILVIDGYIYERVGEPRYEISTYAYGPNFDTTGMFIQQEYDTDIGKKYYFNALQYKEACNYADKIAQARGDDDSIPVRTDCGNEIKVLIQGAVKVSLNSIYINEESLSRDSLTDFERKRKFSDLGIQKNV